VVFTATSLWQEVKLTALAASASSQLRIEIDTSGESLAVSRCSAAIGPWPKDAWTQSTAAATSIRQTIGTSAAAEQWVNAATGEVYLVYAFTSDAWPAAYPTSAHLFNFADAGGGNVDRMIMTLNNTPGTQNLNYNSVGGQLPGTTDPVANQTAEHIARMQWDNANPLSPGVYSRLILDGVVTDGLAAAWAIDGTVLDRIYVGTSTVFGRPIEGCIARICVWALPQAL
jgi:hypothetical protein